MSETNTPGTANTVNTVIDPVVGRLTLPKPSRPWSDRLADRQTLSRMQAALTLGSMIFGGVFILLAATSGPATAGATIACFLSALIVIIAGRLRRKSSLLMVGAALVLASFLTLRTSPWLVSLNAIMIAALGVSAASYNRSGTLWGPMSIIVRRVFRASFCLPVGGSEGLNAVASLLPKPTEKTPDRRAAAGSTRRGVAIAIPLLLVMFALFASADPVFASYVHVPAVSSDWFNNAAVVLLGTVLLFGLTRLAKTSTDDPIINTRAGTQELSIVLGGFVTLYAAFAFTQIVAAIGGATYVMERTGGSYKTYARSGFFQLLIASAITLVLLFIARGSLERREGPKTGIVRVLCVLLCALSILVVLASIQRIALYSQEYGQTMLRVYSSTFAGWLGVVFALIAIAAILPAKRQWIAPASLALAVTGLIGMNLYNPEARIAKNNLDRAVATGDLYTTYFSKLSADAVPTIADGIEKLTGQLKVDSRLQVCRFLTQNPSLSEDSGFLSLNRSQIKAAKAVHQLCDGIALPEAQPAPREFSELERTTGALPPVEAAPEARTLP
jgi:Domain of unknown function (DUF4173)